MRRTPAPPPFSAMNSTPAASSAARIAATAWSETVRRSRSKSITVDCPRPAAFASSVCVIATSPRAALDCATATGVPPVRLLEVYDLLVLALDASEARCGYSQGQREARSYTRTALLLTRKLLGEQI